MASPIQTEKVDSIDIITIDRPENRNAIDSETGEQLKDSLRQLDNDDDLDIGIITGTGGVFCAGADVTEFLDSPSLQGKSDGYMGFSHLRTEKPLIAAIEGPAVGGGVELALFCDLRVASSCAKFGFFEREFGAPLLDGGTQRLPRIIGLGRALDLILTGREISAQEAYDWGMVDRLVSGGDALDEAISLAREIARVPQNAVRSDRRAVYDSLGTPLEQGLPMEAWYGLHSLDSVENRHSIGDQSGR